MEESALHVVITARIFGEEKCFGPGVAMLLERVRTLRSLRAAAMDMDMAYSKAWTILKQAERGLGKKLVTTATAASRPSLRRGRPFWRPTSATTPS
mgnify:CR=1 FL=1